MKHESPRKQCDPHDIAIKSFFLGPQSENAPWLRKQWIRILDEWVAWRQNLFPADGKAISHGDQAARLFRSAARRTEKAVAKLLADLENENPKFTPRYLGHMVSEMNMPAILGHVAALLHNPNNTSREVSRVTSRLEDEAIAGLAKMVGYRKGADGHFTSGGTLANFEALWRSLARLDRRLALFLDARSSDPRADEDEGRFLYGKSEPAKARYREENSLRALGPWAFAARYRAVTGRDFAGPVVLVPGSKHFSWEKGVTVMGLGASAFWSIRLDDRGHLDVDNLRELLVRAERERRPVAMIVSVCGTTELGEVDPVDRVAALLGSYRDTHGYHFWHHVDAAYGGYYVTLLRGKKRAASLSPDVLAALRALETTSSITLDPHKLGYVPYACGAFVARDAEHYEFTSFRAEYLLQENRSRWASTLEGSRSGSGATATWLSNQALGLHADGYGRLLQKGLEARDQFRDKFRQRIPHGVLVDPADLNILCFTIPTKDRRLSSANRKAARIFRHFERSPNFSVSKTILHAGEYGPLIRRICAEQGLVHDTGELRLLRLVLMNPFVTSRECRVDFLGEFLEELARI